LYSIVYFEDFVVASFVFFEPLPQAEKPMRREHNTKYLE
jgi:hypothetical protein